MALANPGSEHALLYVDSSDNATVPGTSWDDWLQGGYGVGTTDTAETAVPEVYVEGFDIYAEESLGHPDASYYNYPAGSEFFNSYFTGTTKFAYGYELGLYDAYEVVSGSPVLIGQAWFINETNSWGYAQLESDMWGGSDYCPYFPSDSFNLGISPRTNAWYTWTTTYSSEYHFATTSGTNINEVYAYSSNPQWYNLAVSGGDSRA